MSNHLHIYKDRQSLNQDFSDMCSAGDIGAKFDVMRKIAYYNGVTVYFITIDEIPVKLIKSRKLDSVAYHDVEPDEATELLLLTRMNR